MTRGEFEHLLDRTRSRLSQGLIGLGRYEKRALLIGCDLAILSFALWIAFAFRYGLGYRFESWQFALLTCSVPVLGVLAGLFSATMETESLPCFVGTTCRAA